MKPVSAYLFPVPESKALQMEESNIYVVDRIAGSRRRKGIRQYLVKWKGYPDSENTWEDEDNIFCKDLIEKYEQSRKAAKRAEAPQAKRKPTLQASSRKAPASKSRPIPNDWDGAVDRVVSVEKGEACGSLLVWLLFKDGRKDSFPAHQVHTRCPLHLLEYYEDNLVFCDDGGGCSS